MDNRLPNLFSSRKGKSNNSLPMFLGAASSSDSGYHSLKNIRDHSKKKNNVDLLKKLQGLAINKQSADILNDQKPTAKRAVSCSRKPPNTQFKASASLVQSEELSGVILAKGTAKKRPLSPSPVDLRTSDASASSSNKRAKILPLHGGGKEVTMPCSSSEGAKWNKIRMYQERNRKAAEAAARKRKRSRAATKKSPKRKSRGRKKAKKTSPKKKSRAGKKSGAKGKKGQSKRKSTKGRKRKSTKRQKG